MPDWLFYLLMATAMVALVILALALLLPAWSRQVFFWLIGQQPAPPARPAASTPLPEGAVVLASSGTDRPLPAHLIGVILAVGVGGFGIHQLLSMLRLFAGSGLDALIGAVYVVECDAEERARFDYQCPSVFADRITYGYTTQYGGGFANKPLKWVLARIHEWGVPIVQAAERVYDAYLRRNQGRTPQLLWIFATLGGHAPLTLPVLDVFRRRLGGTTLTVVVTALPNHDRLRERLLELKPEFEARGADGAILTDNLGVDPTTADYALAALPLALSVAAAFADQPSALNNVLALALNETADGLLILEVVATTVVAWARPDPTATGYFTLKDIVVVALLRMLDQLADGSGQWSVALPAYAPGTSTFDVVMANVTPTFLKDIQDEIVAGQKLRASVTPGGRRDTMPRFGSPNYEVLFAPVPAPMDPDRPSCLLVTTRLASVRDANRLLPEIVKAPADRQLPTLELSRLATHTVDTDILESNGHVTTEAPAS